MINNKVNLCFLKKAAGILLAATSFLVMACSENVKELSPLSTHELGIAIPSGQSREYSYTDKNGGFYYGMTSTDDWGDWFAGWNIYAKRIFADYRLYVDGERLLRENARTSVYPDKFAVMKKLWRHSVWWMNRSCCVFVWIVYKGSRSHSC